MLSSQPEFENLSSIWGGVTVQSVRKRETKARNQLNRHFVDDAWRWVQWHAQCGCPGHWCGRVELEEHGLRLHNSWRNLAQGTLLGTLWGDTLADQRCRPRWGALMVMHWCWWCVCVEAPLIRVCICIVGKQSHFSLPCSGIFRQHSAYYIRQKSGATFST